jgi:hypothetical protein
MGRRSDSSRAEHGFLGDAQAARSADPSLLQSTRFGVPGVRASARTRGGSWRLPPQVSFECRRTPDGDYGRQKPTTQEKCRQQFSLLVHVAPVPPQQIVVPLLPWATEQIRLVSFVQHCWLVVQSEPATCGAHRLHRLHRFRFFASASPDNAASPTTARVDAATPSADCRVLRRVLGPPTSRVSESNRDPSTAASHPGDAVAPPLSTKRRLIGPELLARREQARRCHIGRSYVPAAGSSLSSTPTSSVTPHLRDWIQPLGSGPSKRPARFRRVGQLLEQVREQRAQPVIDRLHRRGDHAQARIGCLADGKDCRGRKFGARFMLQAG